MTNEEQQRQLEKAEEELRTGNAAESEALAKAVLSSTEQDVISYAVNRARALNLLGRIDRMHGQTSRALERFTNAINLSERAHDPVGVARGELNIGNLFRDLSQYEKGLEHYNKALSTFESVNHKEGIAQTLSGIGSVYVFRTEYSHALHYFTQALHINEELNREDGVALALTGIGNVYLGRSEFTQAIEYYNKALKINEKLNIKHGLASTLGNLGRVYRNLSDYAKALEFHSEALRINVLAGDKAGEAVNLGNIGIVYADLGDYTRSLEYDTKALRINEELANKKGIATNLGNIGHSLACLSEYTKALEYYGKAMTIDAELGVQSEVARHRGNIGNAYRKLGDHERAQEYLLSALHLSEEVGAHWPRLHWLLALGELYVDQPHLSENTSEAESYLKTAITDSQQQGVKSITQDATLACYRLYKGQRRWEEAIEMKELHDSVKDEINVDDVRKQDAARRHVMDVELAKAAAAAELKATTSLLHRVLPESVATRIIAGEQEVADYFPQVSILFADIAGFTPISADMPAIIVVRFLNYVFGEFDRIMKKHGCEKIKTIGDGYMAVAGAPIECADHAERLAAAALEMQEIITLPDSIREHMPSGVKLGVRIGLHTGSVVAGVIGDERFVYDVYSDAVNTAARMESHGEEGKIHVSNEFYRHLQNRIAMTRNTTHGFVFEKRGEMEIKGKGMMRTYFLEKA